MIKKKIFSLFALFSLSIFLCSCDNDSNTSNQENKVDNQVATDEKEEDKSDVDSVNEQDAVNDTTDKDDHSISEAENESEDEDNAGGEQFGAAPATSSSIALKIAVAPDYYPFEFKKGDEEIGFNIDLAHFIAKSLNRNLVIQDMDFKDLIPALEKGEVDFLMSSITPTIARAENIDFSNVYFSQDLCMLMKSDADETNVLQLSNQSIGVEKGTVFENYIKSKQEVNPNINVVTYNTVSELTDHLKKGDLNGVLLGQKVASDIKSANSSIYKTSVISGIKEDYAIAFKKDSELLEKINFILNQDSFKQEINNLQKKWFKG